MTLSLLNLTLSWLRPSFNLNLITCLILAFLVAALSLTYTRLSDVQNRLSELGKHTVW